MRQIATITVPHLRTLSELNRRDHWAVRKKRFDGQRSLIRIFAPPSLRLDGPEIRGSISVTLIRYGPRRLDSDNLVASFKAIRDQIAAFLGRDDGDDSLKWSYDQRDGPYAVQVLIDSPAGCTCT